VRFRQDLHAVFLTVPLNGMEDCNDDIRMVRLMSLMGDFYERHEIAETKFGASSAVARRLRPSLTIHLAIFRGWLRDHGVSQIGDPGDVGLPAMIYYRICPWKSDNVCEHVLVNDLVVE
jgi:hypothetical protein